MGRAFEYRKAAKMKRWGNMSRIFPKLAKAIEMAAKSGVKHQINYLFFKSLPRTNSLFIIKCSHYSIVTT